MHRVEIGMWATWSVQDEAWITGNIRETGEEAGKLAEGVGLELLACKLELEGRDFELQDEVGQDALVAPIPCNTLASCAGEYLQQVDKS